MHDVEPEANELKHAGYEIFVGILSILSIVNIALLYAVDDADLDAVLMAMNVLISVIFLGDFTYRLLSSESKSAYVFREFGWADLLASLPFAQAKILRVFRIVRVFRLMRAYGAKRIVRSLVADRAGSALVSLLLMGILVLELGSLEMLNLEQGAPGANITTGSDAIWYVIVTISTVGYGDRFPVTNGGRLFRIIISAWDPQRHTSGQRSISSPSWWRSNRPRRRDRPTGTRRRDLSTVGISADAGRHHPVRRRSLRRPRASRAEEQRRRPDRVGRREATPRLRR